MSKLTRALALLLLVPVLLSGCAVAPPTASEGGGTLTRAMTSEPTGLDPQGAANSGTNLVLPYLFDTLISQQSDGKLVPVLAESWQFSDDGKTLDFVLKKGVKFHDGTPLTPEAVVFTFERFKNSASKSPVATGIQSFISVKALDERTVRFTFAEPSVTFLSYLVSPYAGIMSPTAVEAAGDEVGQRPVGTGPFKIGEWQPGVSIALVRNPDYNWGTPEAKNQGPMHIEKLVFKLIPDAGTQLAALQAGDIDVMFLNEPSQLTKIEQDKNISLQRVDLDSLIYLGYNCAKPPFDEVKVREAFSHAVNKDQIIDLALGGLGTPANTLLTPSMLGYNKDLKSYGYAYDPAKAKALLAEAGFQQAADGTWARDGQKLAVKLLTSTRAPNEAIATVIQSQLKEVGIPVEIQLLDSAAVMKTTTEGAFDLLLWRFEWYDPDGLNMYLSSSQIRGTNRVFYANPEADRLFEQGLHETDAAKRATIYEDAQKLILADAPWHPLYFPVEGLAVRNNVQGIKISAMGRMLVNDVTLGGS
ncbi:MAG: ABC transporter substrate-binding protein [Chloroflexota bacterium]